MSINDLYPPPTMNFIGGGCFKETGDMFVRYFAELGGLKPHERVLDVGCGIGRMAIPLTQYLNEEGSYEGIDVVPMGIDWCREKITPRYPNFRFQLADVFSLSWNPHGRYRAAEYVFPFEDDSFDFVFLTSIFTHLLADEMENYVHEIARVLKVGGRCLSTWFLLNEESLALIQGGRARLSFPFKMEDCFVQEEAIPDAAVGYEEPFVLRMYERFGLQLEGPIRYGEWSGREAFVDAQDIIVAKKGAGVLLPTPRGKTRSALRWYTSDRDSRRDDPSQADPNAAARAIAKAFLTVSQPELVVLELLWERGAMTPDQIAAALYPEGAAEQHAELHKFLERFLMAGLVWRDACSQAITATEESRWVSTEDGARGGKGPMMTAEERKPEDLAEIRRLFEQEAPDVIAEIAPADGMYAGSSEHYFHVGQSALRCVKLALLAAGKEDVRSALDFACGYGRVLRALHAAFPRARLTACDLLHDAVDFCARRFGAAPVYGTPRPAEAPLAGPFDLIWCGTLLTNLNAWAWDELLDLFHAHLAPGGVLVFTTHGRWVAERIRTGACTYGLGGDVLPGLLAGYDRDGFGFGQYPPETLQQARIEGEYGISVSSPAWVCARLARFPGLRLLGYTERLWDDHQDSVACTRERS
jgi:SAM-dependent methyltransferase